MRRSLFVLVLWLGFCCPAVWADAWQVGDMDPTPVPRSLYGPGEEDVLRARLSREPYLALYASVLNTANRSYTLDNHDNTTALNRGNIAKTAAFVYAMNRTISGGQPVPFPDEDSRLAYGRKAETLLLNMYTRSRMTSLPNMIVGIHTAQELTLHVTAYDLLRGADYPFEDEAQVIANLADLTADFYRDWVKDQYPAVNTMTNNHASKATAAIGLAAIVLNGLDLGEDDGFRDPWAWIRWAIPLLDRVIMDSLVTRDGVFGEGAPYYTYSAINHTIFLMALRRYVGVQNLDAWEQEDGRVYGDMLTRIENRRLYDWLVKIQTPDGSFPPFDDSSPGGIALFPHTAPMSNHRLYLWAWERQRNYPHLPESIHQAAETIAWYDDLVQPKSPVELGWPENVFLYDGGSAVFRSDWEDRDARYLIMMAEHGKAKCWGMTREGKPRDGAGGHDHNDPGAIHLQAYGEPLLLDSGYLGWSQHSLVYSAHNHNLVLIDGQGPALMRIKAPNLVQDENGDWIIPEGEEGGYIPGEDGDAYLNDFFDLPGMAYARMDTRYFVKAPSSDVTRHVWFLGGLAFIVWDEITPDDGEPHTYTILWHGNGGGESGGEFTALDDGGIWTRPNARVTVRSQGQSPLSWEIDEDVHDPGSRQPTTHTVIKGSLTDGRASLVSLLLPEPAAGQVGHIDYEPETRLWTLTLNSPARGDEPPDPDVFGFHAPEPGEPARACNMETDARALLCRRDPDSGLVTHFTLIRPEGGEGGVARLAYHLETGPDPRVTVDVHLVPGADVPVWVDVEIPFEYTALRIDGACARHDEGAEPNRIRLSVMRDSRITIVPGESETLRSHTVLRARPEEPMVGDWVEIDASLSCPRNAVLEEYRLIEVPSLSQTALIDQGDRIGFIPDLPGVYLVDGKVRGAGDDRHVLRIEVTPYREPEPEDGDIDGDMDAEEETDIPPVLDGDLDEEDEDESDEEQPEDGDAREGDEDEPEDGDDEDRAPAGDGEGCGCRAQPDRASLLVFFLLLGVLARRRVHAHRQAV